MSELAVDKACQTQEPSQHFSAFPLACSDMVESACTGRKLPPGPEAGQVAQGLRVAHGRACAQHELGPGSVPTPHATQRE